MAKGDEFNIESTFALLATTIDKLENEQISLQDSLNAFEQGIKLTRQAQQTLAEAEQKVKLLLEVDGGPIGKEFSEPTAE